MKALRLIAACVSIFLVGFSAAQEAPKREFTPAMTFATVRLSQWYGTLGKTLVNWLNWYQHLGGWASSDQLMVGVMVKTMNDEFDSRLRDGEVVLKAHQAVWEAEAYKKAEADLAKIKEWAAAYAKAEIACNAAYNKDKNNFKAEDDEEERLADVLWDAYLAMEEHWEAQPWFNEAYFWLMYPPTARSVFFNPSLKDIWADVDRDWECYIGSGPLDEKNPLQRGAKITGVKLLSESTFTKVVTWKELVVFLMKNPKATRVTIEYVGANGTATYDCEVEQEGLEEEDSE